MTNEIKHFGNGGVVFAGEKAVEVYQCIAIAVALKAYAKHKMQMNRHLTPTKMLAFASDRTGHKYTRGMYLLAALALEEYVYKLRKEIEAENAN